MERPANNETEMIHFECLECEMTATAVRNSAARAAWLHHMQEHSRPGRFKAWTWEICPLPY